MASVAALICAVLVIVYFVAIRKPYGVLYSGLRGADAGAIVAELDRKKVPYRLEDGGRTILVPAKLVNGTRLAIMSTDLPLKGAVGFELFNKSDMGLTEFAQRINYQRALQGELARTIMSLDAVDSARVHLSLTEPTIFRDDRRPPRASVTVMTRKGMELPRGSVQGIQRLIASAVPDLDIANVVVLDSQGRLMSDGQAASLLWSARNPDRQTVEDLSAARVRHALERAYPALRFDVVVAKAEASGLASAPGAQTNTGEQVLAEATDAASRVERVPGPPRNTMIVAITLDRPVSVSMEGEIRAIAARELDLEPGRGDVVTVSIGGMDAANGPAPAAGSSMAQQAARPSNLGKRIAAWAWPLVAMCVLLGLLAAAWRLRPNQSRRHLNEEERQAFGDRLRTLLEPRSDHVAPSA